MSMVNSAVYIETLKIKSAALARHYNAARQVAGEQLKAVAPMTIECGGILAELKSLLQHGEWLPFLESISINERTARHWMKRWHETHPVEESRTHTTRSPEAVSNRQPADLEADEDLNRRRLANMQRRNGGSDELRTHPMRSPESFSNRQVADLNPYAPCDGEAGPGTAGIHTGRPGVSVDDMSREERIDHYGYDPFGDDEDGDEGFADDGAEGGVLAGIPPALAHDDGGGDAVDAGADRADDAPAADSDVADGVLMAGAGTLTPGAGSPSSRTIDEPARGRKPDAPGQVPMAREYELAASTRTVLRLIESRLVSPEHMTELARVHSLILEAAHE